MTDTGRYDKGDRGPYDPLVGNPSEGNVTNFSNIAAKLERAAPKLEKEKGPLRLLAMFLRDDVPWTWDLIVSAARLHLGSWADLTYLSELLDETLNRTEILTLSRMIIFEARDPQTDAALAEINGRTGYMELPGDFAGFPIRARVIRAEPPAAKPAAARPRKPPRKTARASRRPAAARPRNKPLPAT